MEIPTKESTDSKHQERESLRGVDQEVDTVRPSNLASLPLPPTIKGGYPIVGRGLEMMKNPLQFLLKWERELGDCFRLEVANRDMYVITNTQASEFAARNGREFLECGTLWADLMKEWDSPNMIVGIDGPQHTEMRRLLKPRMSKDLAVSNHTRIEKITENLLAEIKVGESVSVRNFTRYLVNNIVAFILNGDTELLSKEFVSDAIDWQRQTFNMLVLKKWPKFMKHLPNYKRKEKSVWAYVDKVRTEKENNPGDDFASYFVAAAKERPDLFTNTGDVNFGVLAPLFGGVDTVGTTSTFLIHELCFNAPVRKRVQAAIDNAVKDNNGEIPDPEYLKANVPELYGVCMETMRLYPTAFAVSRTVKEDFAFKGFRIPKGKDLLVFTTAAHFDTRFYKDPETFDIDRYSEPRCEHAQRYAFLPYGIGTHVCLGAGFSELMFLSIAATLIYHFDFEVVDPNREYKIIFDPSIGIETDFEIRMKERRH